MNDIILEQAKKLNKKHKRRKRWQIVVSVMGCFVVFCTAYALILPAITMTNDYYCGQEEHLHGPECLSQETSQGHQHTDDCYLETTVYSCGLEESEGHIHDESCYEEQDVQECDLEESDGHSHEEDCYDQEGELVCSIEESEGHTHDETCYSSSPIVICELEETVEHHHSEECQIETVKNLVCTEEEDEISTHEHTPNCFENGNMEDGSLICGSMLICQIPVHEHTEICSSDKEADLETSTYWESILPNNLTNNWNVDLNLVAESQLGYKESVKNFIITNEGKRSGYTRYGQWYGDLYGDWSAMFTSFCLHYANIPEAAAPISSNVEAMRSNWVNMGLYESGYYIPTAGDLVFFDSDQDGIADHMGIVKNSDTTNVSAIEGDSADMVREVTYSLTEGSIMGYGNLTTAYARWVQLESGETKEIQLTAQYNGIEIILTASNNELPDDIENLQLVVSEPDEELQKQIDDLVGSDKANLAINIKIIRGEEEVIPSGIVQVVFKHVTGLTIGASIDVYQITQDSEQENIYLTDLPVTLDEEGSLIMETANLATYVLAWESSEELDSTLEDTISGWQGESNEAQRSLSTLAIDGSIITPSGSDKLTGVAGLTIQGTVEGYSTLDCSVNTKYSTGDQYYYYVVADVSETGGRAFMEPDGAPYVVCCRYMEDGRIGWYLRERPQLTFANKLVRIGTGADGQDTTEHQMVMHVEMNGFAYEWSNSDLNHVDFTWNIYSGVANASMTTGKTIFSESANNEDGIFTNIKFTESGEEAKYLSGFDIILDKTPALEPQYYAVNVNLHIRAANGLEEEMIAASYMDAARCVYDFAKPGEPNGDGSAEGIGGYVDSIMTTYEYRNGVPPRGVDDALLRLYLPEGMSAAAFLVQEDDGYFDFEGDGNKTNQLIPYTDILKNFKTDDSEIYNKAFAITIQVDGNQEYDLQGGAKLPNPCGTEQYICSVYSHKNLDFEDISQGADNANGLRLLLQLISLTKNDKPVGQGDPININNGELRIQTLMAKDYVEDAVSLTVTQEIIPLEDGVIDTTEFGFILTYADVVENFSLKHGESYTVMIPCQSEVVLTQTGNAGYKVKLKITNETKAGTGLYRMSTANTEKLVYADTIALTMPAEAQEDPESGVVVTASNSPGSMLPQTGGPGLQNYVLYGLSLMAGAAVCGYFMRHKKRS